MRSLDKIKINPILIKILFISVLIICPDIDAGYGPGDNLSAKKEAPWQAAVRRWLKRSIPVW
jgi:hypothetical protein